MAICTAASPTTIRAQNAGPPPELQPPEPQYGWQEVWAGADATKDVWLLYSGITLAPLSKDIYSPGLRLRAAGGYGKYQYAAVRQRFNPCGPPFPACVREARRFNVDFTYAEALIGYQDRFGELTAKGFIGIASVSHQLRQADTLNDANGSEIGIKGVVELWYNVGQSSWTSLDLAYTTAHETGSARWRGGWRVFPQLSVGPELRFDSTGENQSGRAGAFVRYEWVGGEISGAAGFAETINVDEENRSLYGTVNLLLQF